MDAARTAIPFAIRPAAESELATLAEHFLPNSRALDHARRFAFQQRGDGRYLIAWHGAEPVGHLVIRWQGPSIDQTGKYPPQTPYLEAAMTKPEYRSRGIGTCLIREAEQFARSAGFAQVGLTVSSRDNPRARHLYERLGYRAWDGGEYPASWPIEMEDGSTATGSGVFVYLFKPL